MFCARTLIPDVRRNAPKAPHQQFLERILALLTMSYVVFMSVFSIADRATTNYSMSKIVYEHGYYKSDSVSVTLERQIIYCR